jgi:ABC-2 type transport system permease protein
MENNITATITPSSSQILASLLRADFTVQWRNRRASLMTLLVPIIILISWRSIVLQLGGAFALSSCITFGLVAVGLMGYSNTTARDREKGVFQRLRATPAATWAIMASRLIVQLAQIFFMTCVIFIVGYFLDKIILTPGQYLLTIFMALVSGCVYLGLGQTLVGLISSAETLNSVTRLVYFAFIIVGAFGELGALGSVIQKIVAWSPYGTVKSILFASMQPGAWNGHVWLTLVITLAYAILFAGVGIKWFKWVSQ